MAWCGTHMTVPGRDVEPPRQGDVVRLAHPHLPDAHRAGTSAALPAPPHPSITSKLHSIVRPPMGFLLA